MAIETLTTCGIQEQDLPTHDIKNNMAKIFNPLTPPFDLTATQASDITDFDTEVSNNTDVAANTSARHSAVTVLDGTTVDFTLTGQQITAEVKDNSITEPKLAMNDSPSDGEVVSWNATGGYMEWKATNYAEVGHDQTVTLASTTYSPSLTNTTNVAASTAFTANYTRVGNVVTVGGAINIDPTATGNTVIGISIPVASNFTAQVDLGGVGSSATGEVGSIVADSTNDRATFQFTASNTANHTFSFMFMYIVK